MSASDVEYNHGNAFNFLEAAFPQLLAWTVSFARTSSLDSLITPPKVLKLDFGRKSKDL